jgi:hypothetical protein
MTFHLNDAPQDFERFWTEVNGIGDMEAALKEWQVRHNASEDSDESVKEEKRKSRFFWR